MSKFTTIVGIDVGKSSLSVCIQNANGKLTQFDITNNASGLSELLGALKKAEPDKSKILVCCENTGRYMSHLAYVCNGSQLTLWAVHPMVIANYNPDFERAKTDSADAKRIMEFAFAHQHKAIDYHLPERIIMELKELFLLRKQLVGQCRQSQNHLSSAKDPTFPSHYTIAVHKQVINMLKHFIKQVEKAIIALVKSDKDLLKKYNILLSVPGIGPVTAQHILFKTEGFKIFKSWKAFSCYIGSAPFEKQSGTSIKYKPKTSKKAYRKLKADFNQGVTSVTQKGRFFHDYYQAMAAKNIQHLKIINNIINMIIKTAFALIKNNECFDKEKFLANKLSWKNNLDVS